MVAYMHGFDWSVYSERVMPACARWLIEKDDAAIYQLFEKTRCALEEQYLPEPMQKLRVWPRAKAFVDLLPRGPHSRKEYTKLCSPETFTGLSDLYMHHYAPHLYQNSNALRSVWGAIIEEYCSPWLHSDSATQPDSDEARLHAEQQAGRASPEVPDNESEGSESTRAELIALLRAAGLGDLAEEVGEHMPQIERFDWIAAEEEEDAEGAESDFDEDAAIGHDAAAAAHVDDEDGEDAMRARGIIIGQHSHTLHLRGWLATHSVRAMALFEYLALGRRAMPFGYELGEPFGSYIGYLTPDEVWQLATCLRDVSPPDKSAAEQDYLLYCQQQKNRQDTSYRVIDEVLPTYAAEFLQAARQAALQGLGLICSVD